MNENEPHLNRICKKLAKNAMPSQGFYVTFCEPHLNKISKKLAKTCVAFWKNALTTYLPLSKIKWKLLIKYGPVFVAVQSNTLINSSNLVHDKTAIPMVSDMKYPSKVYHPWRC